MQGDEHPSDKGLVTQPHTPSSTLKTHYSDEKGRKRHQKEKKISFEICTVDICSS